MMPLFTLSLQASRTAGSRYTAPYDSTQGVPNYVFIGFWILIIFFVVRIVWAFRDKIFEKKK